MTFDKAPSNKTETHSFDLWQKCFAEIKDKKDEDFVPPIIKNKEGKILAPNGEISKLPNEDLVKITRTAEFKAWFGDWVSDKENSSKVVYPETGEPMVVYHGVTRDLPNAESGLSPERFAFTYFTSKFEHAFHWSYVLGNFETVRGFNNVKDHLVFTCFLNLRNPIIIDREPDNELSYQIKKGKIEYDSIIQNTNFRITSGQNSDQFLAKDKEQIMHLPSDISNSFKD